MQLGEHEERVKELDFEHRLRERSVARLTLSLTFLRRAWTRWWTPTRAAVAASVAHPPPGTLAVTFVGHATVMITSPQARLLTDPLLENSLLGLRRAHAAALHPSDLDDVTLVLISHIHRDHLSPRTLRRLAGNTTVVAPAGCGARLRKLGLRGVVELGVGQSFGLADLKVTAVPACHAKAGADSADRTRRDRPAGPVGYVIQGQGRTVYFAGDTGYFRGFREIGERFAPDVALLPIAGYQPAPFRREHLSPLDAAYAFEDLRAKVFIPITHGSFELGYEPIAEPLTWLRALGKERALTLAILDHGQTCLIR